MLQTSIIVNAASQVLARYTVYGNYRVPDIRYPAFGLAGYLAKTVSGASLAITTPMVYVFTEKFVGIYFFLVHIA
jgi:hypothetical protein